MARAGTCTRTHTTSQTSTHNRVAANARPRTQRGHDSTPPTSGRSPYFKLHEQATTAIQLYQVPPAGVEPATYSLRVNCSNQLSYGGFILRAPGGTRTRNLPHRKRALCPLSYRSKRAI